ncbi:MAG: hypothetical protein M3Y87_21230, partial [Myxococcota bacterium]|nr:hypothetical protein [Myxococcota bacterium]
MVREPVDEAPVGGEDDDDGASVPAGTWASTAESDTPPVPFGDADSRKMRRISADDATGERATHDAT